MITLKTRGWRLWPDGVCHQPFYTGFDDMENRGGVVCTPRGNVCLGRPAALPQRRAATAISTATWATRAPKPGTNSC